MERQAITFQIIAPIVARAGPATTVGISGRALLMAEEGQDHWVAHCIEPGGLSARGPTAEEALDALLHRLKVTISDMAEEAHDREAFDSELERFLGVRDEELFPEWIAERAAAEARGAKRIAGWKRKREQRPALR